MRRFRDAAGSLPFRYAAVFACVAAVVMSILLGIAYSRVSSILDRHLDESIMQELSGLRNDFAQDGRDSLIGLVRQHARRTTASPIHALVQDGEGRVIAGDLPSVPLSEGWLDLELPKDSAGSNETPRHYRAFGSRLDEDTFVLVAIGTEELHETSTLLVWSFSIVLGVSVLLSLVGGLVIGRVLISRVRGITSVAQAIMDGDLSQRIPVPGVRKDALTDLVESLNRMLHRLQENMENVRHISNNLSHDLRSPLGRHLQRLESIRLKPRDRSEYEAAIDAAIQDIHAILKIFDAMLRISQIEAGTSRPRFSTVTLSEIAENVFTAYEAVAEEQGKRMVGDIAPDVRVRGDASLITQVLVNLVENSLRHAPEGRKISIRVEMREKNSCVIVTDDGPGIPVDERDRVFRHFYRLDASRSTPGSGLGLSFVSAVVKAHDAEIILDDNKPGLRTSVIFPNA